MRFEESESQAVIRVASIPAGHPYVQAITDPARVCLLRDPPPPHATEPGQWWPPQWLEPDYLLRRIDEIDVAHVHFGFDSTPIEALAAVCAALAAHRVPLILTVHDLHNPHFTDSAAHLRRLEVLLSAATNVITLTAGAARAIATRWNRAPVVLAHPYLLPLREVGAPRIRRDRAVVAVQAKCLRANVDPWPILERLTVSGVDASLRLDLEDSALTSPRAPRGLTERLAHYVSAGVDVRVHPPFSDAGLVRYLREIDVLVLPYRFGTHSGWVECCYDAGVRAVVPDCGHFSEQHPARIFGFDVSRLDDVSLDAAVSNAVFDARSARVDDDAQRRRRRAAQRQQVQCAHVDIYRRAMNDVAA